MALDRQALSTMYAGRRLSDLAYERGAEARAVTVRIYDRYGDLQTITNVTRFLGASTDAPSLSNFLNAAHGKRLSTAGWTVLPTGATVGVVSREPRGVVCGTCGLVLLGYTLGGARLRHANKCSTDRALVEAACALGNITAAERATRLRSSERSGSIEVRATRPSPGALIAPSGELHPILYPFGSFCEERGIAVNKTWKVLTGRALSHRGWRLAEASS
jgi:hypothetical protein